MAEQDELSESTIETMRLALTELKRDLESQLSANADAAKPVKLDQTAVGRVSRVDAMQSQAMAQAARQSLTVRISQCENALRAIDQGEYGVCRLCEEPIAAKRLAVRPEAPFCLDCQRGADRR